MISTTLSFRFADQFSLSASLEMPRELNWPRCFWLKVLWRTPKVGWVVHSSESTRFVSVDSQAIRLIFREGLHQSSTMMLHLCSSMLHRWNIALLGCSLLKAVRLWETVKCRGATPLEVGVEIGKQRRSCCFWWAARFIKCLGLDNKAIQRWIFGGWAGYSLQ